MAWLSKTQSEVLTTDSQDMKIALSQDRVAEVLGSAKWAMSRQPSIFSMIPGPC